ncbi:CcdB family protein [Falsiroseomonas oryziterrae]|uniref:CcdB family protein n=1 Tax=Falsiroseomonas oryziterrae TaxID=2911368 RepID=UPI001F1BFAA0|nr:CcdB family protein [Roseomonas sp. NPKOSM-4]
MARFDLFRAQGGRGYLLDVQHRMHDHLSTRVVIPLLPEADAPPPSRDLNPRFVLEDGPHLLFPQYLAAVPKRELGRPVANLEAHRDAVTKALDLLLTGF